MAFADLFPVRKRSNNQRSAMFETPPYQPKATGYNPFGAVFGGQPGSPVVPPGTPGWGSTTAERAPYAATAMGLTPAAASPTADAARLLSGAVAGNPFVTAEGLGRLQQGYAPLLHELDPSFWYATSPTIRDALIGLYQSMGMRPEDIEHAFRQWTPPGLGW